MAGYKDLTTEGRSNAMQFTSATPETTLAEGIYDRDYVIISQAASQITLDREYPEEQLKTYIVESLVEVWYLLPPWLPSQIYVRLLIYYLIQKLSERLEVIAIAYQQFFRFALQTYVHSFISFTKSLHTLYYFTSTSLAKFPISRKDWKFHLAKSS